MILHMQIYFRGFSRFSNCRNHMVIAVYQIHELKVISNFPHFFVTTHV